MALFGGLGLLVIAAGVALALFEQYRIESETEGLAGALMADAVRGHLQQRTIDGHLAYVAPPPSDDVRWAHFRTQLRTMLNAAHVHVLNSSGAVVDGEWSSKVGLYPALSEQWKEVMAGHVAHYVRPHDGREAASVSGGVFGGVFGVAVPVAFLASDSRTLATGAVTVELSAAPLLRTARSARNSILLSTAGVLMVLLGALWLLTRRLAARSFRDPLTGLPNRRCFTEAAAVALAHNERHERPSALLVADINRFGQLNISLGHHAGDAVLQSVARALSRRSRAGDIVARISGDGFALLLNEASAEQARLVADSIATTLETATALDSQRLRISVSIGIAAFPRHGRSIEDLLQRADSAMREAKRSKMPFAMFEAGNTHITGERLNLEADLRDALIREQLHVHFQPIVASGDGALVAYEALARWDRADGPVSPAAFIPVAENTGLIRQLDRYVYQHAVKTVAAIRRRSPAVRIAVNLSPQTLADSTLPAFLRDVAERHGVAPSRLAFEVTESAAVESLDRTTATLQSLRDLGFRIALDDFGTGFSSLAYLRTLPIDTVKIDRQFIAGIGQQASDETLIRAIVTYAKSLAIRTLAEGVETREQHLWLQQQGIDYEQGYLHGKPAAIPLDVPV